MGLGAWQQFLNDDNTAFTKLYQYYYNEMLAYGLKVGFEKKSVEDAIQDVFIKILLSKDKLRHVQNIEFYLLNSLKNRLYDFHNDKMKLQNVVLEDLKIENEDSAIEAIISTEKEEQLINEIKQTLKYISPKQRKIIYYHYHLNLSFNEIATILDTSPEAVR